MRRLRALVAVALWGFAAVGVLPQGGAAAAGTVTLNTTSLVGGQTADWSFTFASPGLLPAGSGTITLTAPLGFGSSFTVQDLTTGTTAAASAVATTTGGVALTVAQVVYAGDTVSVSTAAANPGGAIHIYPTSAFSVRTSAAPSVSLYAAATPPVAQGGEVTFVNGDIIGLGASAAFSSELAGAPGTTWTAGFAPVADLAAGDSIDLEVGGATAAGFPTYPQDYTITVPGGSYAPAAVSVGPAPASFDFGFPVAQQVALTLPAGAAIPLLANVTIQARGITNPSGGMQLGITTSRQATLYDQLTSVDFTGQGGASGGGGGSSVTTGSVHIQTGATVLPAATLPPNSPNVTPLGIPLGAGWLRFDPTVLNNSTTCETIQAAQLDPAGLGSPTPISTNPPYSAYVVDSPTVTVYVLQEQNLSGPCGYSLKLQAFAVDGSGNVASTPLAGSSVTTSGSDLTTLTFTLPSLATGIELQATVECTGGFDPTCGSSPAVAKSAVLQIVQTPTAVEQLDALPYKILYDAPGASSSSSFSLTQSQTSQTDYSLTSSKSNTQANSHDVGVSVEAGVKAAGWSASVSNSSDWDHKTSNTTGSSTATASGVAISSSFGQTWKSFSGISALAQPGAQPWEYDEFVLLVHPQFAIWDNVTCPSGSAPSGGGCSGSATPTGQPMYAMMGARNSYLDVSAGQLLTCAQGTPLAVPGDYVPELVLPPSECSSLLRLDPFAVAGTQAADPSAQLGGLATPVSSFTAGSPTLGTNGTYAVTLTASQAQKVSTTHTSSFSSTVDSMFTDKAAVKVGYSGGLGSLASVSASATASYTTSNSTAVTQGVTISQSQTAATTVQDAASATLGDAHNPVVANIWLDQRWDTLMFQVPPAQVTSVSPAQGSPDIQVTIDGAGFWTGPAGAEFCPVGGSGACQAATVTSLPSNDEMKATVPVVPPGTYRIDVLTPAGASTPDCPPGTTGCAQFTVLSALTTTGPTVDGISPATAPDGGGTQVTITGASLGEATAVWFGAEAPDQDPALLQAFLSSGASGPPPVAPAPAYRVLSGSEIIACAPAVSQPETVWVSVYGPQGWSPVTPASEFQYTGGSATGTCGTATLAGAPAVTALSPSSGPANGGTLLTITGSNFQPTVIPAACTAANCPSGGTVDLLLPPTVELCELTGAPCATATDVRVLSPTEITAQAPPGVGTLNVRVEGSAGFSAVSGADQFTYTPATTCGGCPGAGSLALGATPPVAAIGPGSATVVATVVDGSGDPVAQAPVVFRTDAGSLSVAGAVYTDSAGVAQATLTSRATGPATVTAVVYGSPELENQTSVAFAPLPVVGSVQVSGTTATIHGSGFSGADAVLFGPNAANAFTVDSDSLITASIPPGFGQVDVRVANPAVESGASQADLYTYGGSPPPSGSGVLEPPVVTGLTPALGPASGGTTVALTGANFTGAAAVLFGGVAGRDLSVGSDGSLTVQSPPGAGTVDVTVVGRGGTSTPTAAGQFRYEPLPTVTTLGPASGPLGGGNVITIGGSGLSVATARSVLFGGTPATSVVVRSDEELSVGVPAAAQAGRVDVTVSLPCDSATATACGTSLINPADGYTYLPPPSVSGLSVPSGALAGGTAVLITGTGFTTATAVDFGATPVPFTVVSDGEIQATSPAGAPGTVDVTVTTTCDTPQTLNASSCGSSAAVPAGRFTFGTPPTLTSLSPAQGPAAGGTEVTLRGAGLQNVTAVDFGSVPATSYSANAAGDAVTATSPRAPAGRVDVTVTTACATAAAPSCGTSPIGAAAAFTFLPLPEVSGVSPALGGLAGGGQVEIAGSGFTSATAVDFGGRAATFTIDSDVEITATVPAGSAPGSVDVTVTTGCASSTATSCGTSLANAGDRFAYYPAAASAVVRTLQPGWNTLSIPFPLANPELSQILSDHGASLEAAYIFGHGRWFAVSLHDPDVLQVPMAGLFVMIAPSAAPVTATFEPAGAPAGSASLPPAPNLPPTLDLQQGWNLVGPSAILGSESYHDFLASVADHAVTMLIDPNGADVPVIDPGSAAAGQVENGFAYWVYADQPGQSLVGEVLTGRTNGPGR